MRIVCILAVASTRDPAFTNSQMASVMSLIRLDAKRRIGGRKTNRKNRTALCVVRLHVLHVRHSQGLQRKYQQLGGPGDQQTQMTEPVSRGCRRV